MSRGGIDAEKIFAATVPNRKQYTNDEKNDIRGRRLSVLSNVTWSLALRADERTAWLLQLRSACFRARSM